jgi:hypothetical protein
MLVSWEIRTMFWSAIALLIILAVAVFFLYSLYAWRRKRVETISGLLAGRNLLASWPYSAEQWRKAVEDEFTWAWRRGGPGHIYISPDALYIKAGKGGRFVELAGGGRVVTHASLTAGDMGLLKLRVRRKVVFHQPDRADEVKYYRDDYRIPVPASYREEAIRVVSFFNSRLEMNLEAYADSVSDDEPLSIFGKDPF